MRPILMIEDLRNLHDARYCAAVGISMGSFDLEVDSPTSLTPQMVKEIVEWLSGMRVVGRFGYEPATEISRNAETAMLDYILVPGDYDLEAVSRLDWKPFFDMASFSSDNALMQRLETLSIALPEALFLIDFDPASMEGGSSSPFPGLLERCILRFHDPDAIFQQLKHGIAQPFGFSLGAFVAEDNGHLDYDACDAFIESYHTLVSA